MYDSDNLQCMIDCLEEHRYAYTNYEHRNGYCSINSDLLLNQLKLNETEIRNKAIDEFEERLKESSENMYGQKYIDIRVIDEIAEEMREV